MVNNVYDLVTRTMEQEFPGRVAFRCLVCPEHPGGGG